MQIKDIVNRDAVNLTNCDHEPIHIPGSIQPHGFLLGVKRGNLVIDFCSANSFEYTGYTYEQLLGQPVSFLLGEPEALKFFEPITSDSRASSAPINVSIAGKNFICLVQKSPELYMLEFESVVTETIAINDIYLQTKQFTDYMQNATTLQSLCQAVADETRAITGYDRVMIYKFDKDYNGEVFAESRTEEVEPFLGLHYPHTDIPVQARELYIRNLLRLIVDIYYQPVPIYTVDDMPGKNLDLSLSVLRSVSPIHVQYLSNMGVGATLTISLIYEKKLWGMITCHHYSPKYLSMHTRIAAQLQGHFLTSQIPVRQDAEEYAVAKKVNEALENLLTQVFSSKNVSLKALVQQEELLQLCNAAGVAILVENKMYSRGNVLPEEEIRQLANWLQTYSSPSGFSTGKLVDTYSDAARCSAASGVIFHTLGSGADNCIIWCRPETREEVLWAGDPQKAIVKDEKGLSPRKSFELWKEVKKCESQPWLKPELVAADNFANALQKHVHMLYLSKEEQKQRKLSEKLKEANAELENINWIGSHDLKEPLRKIQMFASRILEDEPDGTQSVIIESVKRMSESARRMQVLIKDILSYSRLSHVEEGFHEVDLNQLVADVIEELHFEINEKSARIDCGHLPAINGVPFLLKQLFVNLLRNALKFSKADTPAVIKIEATNADKIPAELQSQGTFYKITVTDNGIGFQNQYKESIFKVFTRLQHGSEYQGTGVGLALCRKIMQNHSGYITADGTPGEGATFTLYFPKAHDS